MNWQELPELDKQLVIQECYRMVAYHFDRMLQARSGNLKLAEDLQQQAFRTCQAAIQHLGFPLTAEGGAGYGERVPWIQCEPGLQEMVVSTLLNYQEKWFRDSIRAGEQDLPKRQLRAIALRKAFRAAIVELGYENTKMACGEL